MFLVRMISALQQTWTVMFVCTIKLVEAFNNDDSLIKTDIQHYGMYFFAFLKRLVMIYVLEILLRHLSGHAGLISAM